VSEQKDTQKAEMPFKLTCFCDGDEIPLPPITEKMVRFYEHHKKHKPSITGLARIYESPPFEKVGERTAEWFCYLTDKDGTLMSVEGIKFEDGEDARRWEDAHSFSCSVCDAPFCASGGNFCMSSGCEYQTCDLCSKIEGVFREGETFSRVCSSLCAEHEKGNNPENWKELQDEITELPPRQ